MFASELSAAQLTRAQVGDVTRFIDDDPVIDPTHSIVSLRYHGIPIQITVSQGADGILLGVKLDLDEFVLSLLPGAHHQLDTSFDRLKFNTSADEPSVPNESPAHLVIGTDSNYEAGMLTGILESDQLTDGVVAQLLRAAIGEIEVYRDLLDEADSEIRDLEFWDEQANHLIGLAFQRIKELKKLVKKLKRQRQRAYDKGFQAAMPLIPDGGVDADALEEALINGSQDPEFAAARTKHENQTA